MFNLLLLGIAQSFCVHYKLRFYFYLWKHLMLRNIELLHLQLQIKMKQQNMCLKNVLLSWKKCK